MVFVTTDTVKIKEKVLCGVNMNKFYVSHECIALSKKCYNFVNMDFICAAAIHCYS